MKLERLLQSQGFGTRAEVRSLILEGRIVICGETCTDPMREFQTDNLVFYVDGVPWKYHKFAYLAMNKPANFECSQRPSHYPSVYSLLPEPLRRRGVQAVGRLDADTTGLLLFSDDGQFIHAMTSPKKSIGKCYEITARHSVNSQQLEALLNGVVLRDDPLAVRALQCRLLGPTLLQMTIGEGRYHQVKRMIAASGNRVEHLKRVGIGAFMIPSTLASGEWQWLDVDAISLLASPLNH